MRIPSSLLTGLFLFPIYLVVFHIQLLHPLFLISQIHNGIRKICQASRSLNIHQPPEVDAIPPITSFMLPVKPSFQASYFFDNLKIRRNFSCSKTRYSIWPEQLLSNFHYTCTSKQSPPTGLFFLAKVNTYGDDINADSQRVVQSVIYCFLSHAPCRPHGEAHLMSVDNSKDFHQA